MTEKRFTITQDFEEHHRQIRDNGKIIMGCFLEPQAEPIVNLLNELHEENEQLKCGNKNLKATLNDFINILNRLQSNQNDKQTLSVARDMLQNMGKELEE